MKPLKNIAYTYEYKQFEKEAKQKQAWLLEDAYFFKEHETKLEDGYSFHILEYRYTQTRKVDWRKEPVESVQSSYCIEIKYGSHTIYKENNTLYTPALIIPKIINHPNKNKYILFRRDLYGYSIFNCNTKKVFHYIPEGYLEGKESFIWVQGEFFKRECGLLLISGCFWACPYSTLVVDFSNPEKQPYPYFDCNEMIADLEKEEYYYNDIDFLCFTPEYDMQIKVQLYEDEPQLKKSPIQIIPKSQYLHYLNKAK